MNKLSLKCVLTETINQIDNFNKFYDKMYLDQLSTCFFLIYEDLNKYFYIPNYCKQFDISDLSKEEKLSVLQEISQVLLTYRHEIECNNAITNGCIYCDFTTYRRYVNVCDSSLKTLTKLDEVLTTLADLTYSIYKYNLNRMTFEELNHDPSLVRIDNRKYERIFYTIDKYNSELLSVTSAFNECCLE